LGTFEANRLAYSISILITLTVGILIGTVISSGVKGQDKKSSSSDAAMLSVPSPQMLSNQFSQISKQLEPSVVNINTESTIKTRGGAVALPMATMMPIHLTTSLTAFSEARADKVGQGPGGGAIRERSLGSGVIVDPKGYIVTNRHVVEKATGFGCACRTIRGRAARSQGHRIRPGKPTLAVIKIEGDKPSPLPNWAIPTACKWEIGCWL
jgi:serine protease Do